MDWATLETWGVRRGAWSCPRVELSLSPLAAGIASLSSHCQYLDKDSSKGWGSLVQGSAAPVIAYPGYCAGQRRWVQSPFYCLGWQQMGEPLEAA